MSREANECLLKDVVSAVYETFAVGETYLLSEVNSKLKSIFSVNGVRVDGRGVGNALKKYFEVEECWKQKSKAVRIAGKVEIDTT